MKKLVTAALFSALFSVSAMAGEATVLTGKSLDQVTAGVFQQNNNSTWQSATAVAIGGCNFAFCGKKSGNATAIASNVNVTEQENEVD
jgi:hypothetical protein